MANQVSDSTVKAGPILVQLSGVSLLVELVLDKKEGSRRLTRERRERVAISTGRHVVVEVDSRLRIRGTNSECIAQRLTN